VILNYCLGSVVYNFQIENKETKLLMHYESITQKVLLVIEPILQNAKQLQRARLSWRVMFEYYRPRKPRQ
jgi:hypothetical protein